MKRSPTDSGEQMRIPLLTDEPKAITLRDLKENRHYRYSIPSMSMMSRAAIHPFS